MQFRLRNFSVFFASKLGTVKNFYLRKIKIQYYQRKHMFWTIKLFYKFDIFVNIVQLRTTVNLIKAWLQNVMHESRILVSQGRNSLSHRLGSHPRITNPSFAQFLTLAACLPVNYLKL